MRRFGRLRILAAPVLTVAALAVFFCVTGCRQPCDVAPRAFQEKEIPWDQAAVIDVSGTWLWNMHRKEGGGHHGTWRLVQAGHDLMGTHLSLCHREQRYIRGFIQGNRVVINAGPYRFTGMVDGREMSGNWTNLEHPSAPGWKWDAIRKEG
jgi:hypothetical protein